MIGLLAARDGRNATGLRYLNAPNRCQPGLLRRAKPLLGTLVDSPAQWNLLAQQTLFAKAALPSLASPTAESFSSDGWDGAPATRDRIVKRWAEAKVSNPITLGGDIHMFAAADIMSSADARPIATEFVGGSITSFGLSDLETKIFKSRNPHLQFFEGRQRGYGLMDISGKTAKVAFRAIADAKDANSPVSDLATYVVETGRAGVVAG